MAEQFFTWESANQRQDGLALTNQSGIAFAVQMPDGSIMVTDDQQEKESLKAQGGKVSYINRASFEI